MPTFDVVCKIDLQEMDNAINNTKREVENRFDFKGSNSTIERNDYSITVETSDQTKLNQLNELLKNNSIRRKIDPHFIKIKETESASGNRVREKIELLNGISKEDAKKITTTIKDTKLKVQASINGDEVRVTGKKKDDLQETMTVLKEKIKDLPLQFQNFRD